MDLAVFDVTGIDPGLARPGGFIELLERGLRRRCRRRRCRHDRLRNADGARPARITASIAAAAVMRWHRERFSRRSARPSSAFLARPGARPFRAVALATALSPPYYLRVILRQMLDIGYFSLPVVGLTAIFTGMVLALQSYTGFSRFSAESAVATVVVLSITRELGPVIAGLMVAGRVGAAMAAEIGTMRVTDQIDALTTLSTNPLQLSGPAAARGRPRDPAVAGRRRRHHRRVWRLSRRHLQIRLQPGALSRPDTEQYLRNQRCGLRSRQSGGVRLYRGIDGLLLWLSLARRSARGRSGDDLRGRVGFDPDPGRSTTASPRRCLRNERNERRGRSENQRARTAQDLWPQSRARRHRPRGRRRARALSLSAARASANRC